jgi:hypothetical protein
MEPRRDRHRAVLTQNTAWVNVERALASLRTAGLIDLGRLATMTPERSHRSFARRLFQSQGRRLRAVAEFFAPGGKARYGELAAGRRPLREALLGVYGVGPETADSILLYALERPTFVIDATRCALGGATPFSDDIDYPPRANGSWHVWRPMSPLTTNTTLCWSGSATATVNEASLRRLPARPRDCFARLKVIMPGKRQGRH